MKRMDIFCASQASTAICLSMDQASCSSSNTVLLGGRTIDRHNPIINDSRRSTSKSLTAPCSSCESPINPKPYRELHKAKKNSSLKNGTKGHDNLQKKSTAEKLTEHVTHTSTPTDGIVRRSRLKPPGDLITPPGSTRSLLSDTALLDGSSDYDPVLALATNKTSQIFHQDEANPVSKHSSTSHPKSGSTDQVVVLRVSLHCKGCEGKVRKHLSRMQGVSSFNIDYAAKKVTVVGDVTPLSVLASVSKVKNAQLWPASASAVGSGMIETKKKTSTN